MCRCSPPDLHNPNILIGPHLLWYLSISLETPGPSLELAKEVDCDVHKNLTKVQSVHDTSWIRFKLLHHRNLASLAWSTKPRASPPAMAWTRTPKKPSKLAQKKEKDQYEVRLQEASKAYTEKKFKNLACTTLHYDVKYHTLQQRHLKIHRPQSQSQPGRQLQWVAKVSQCLVPFYIFENNSLITTNGKAWLVYERQYLIKAIQQCNDHVILISNHGDISKSIWGIIGTLLHLSFCI